MKKQTVSEYECLKCKRRVNFYSNKDNFYTHCKICGSELKHCWTHPYNPDSSLKTINNYNKMKLSQNKRNEDINHLSNTPKCPTCQSTNVRKMSGLERGASISAFGIFSKKINKTFKCKSCGYTW